MSTRDFSDQLRITSPCDMNWDDMIGNDRVRFCQHCQLSVHNLDIASRKQIRRLLARSQGRLCVRYVQPPLAHVSAAPVLHKIGRRASVIAAGAFSATLGLSTATVASPNVKQFAFPSQTISAVRLADHFAGSDGATLRGVIFDPNGAVVPGAKVSITNTETNEQFSSSSNDKGEYLFEGLNPGTYNLKIESPGFQTAEVQSVGVQLEGTHIDQTLSVASGTAMAGAVAVVTPSDPLVKAAYEDDLEALRTVLLTRPDANVRDKETHSTALEHAVRNGNREMVQVLLWAKADINARDSEGQTVLMMLGEQVTSEMVWDLIHAGAKVNLRDKDGDTPLMSMAEVNNVDALRTLLDAGAKVNARNDKGETALMIAAENGQVNIAQALILAGAEVNARDKQGKSALMYATGNSEAAVARLLKANGAIEFEAPEKQ